MDNDVISSLLDDDSPSVDATAVIGVGSTECGEPMADAKITYDFSDEEGNEPIVVVDPVHPLLILLQSKKDENGNLTYRRNLLNSLQIVGKDALFEKTLLADHPEAKGVFEYLDLTQSRMDRAWTNAVVGEKLFEIHALVVRNDEHVKERRQSTRVANGTKKAKVKVVESEAVRNLRAHMKGLEKRHEIMRTEAEVARQAKKKKIQRLASRKEFRFKSRYHGIGASMTRNCAQAAVTGLYCRWTTMHWSMQRTKKLQTTYKNEPSNGNTVGVRAKSRRRRMGLSKVSLRAFACACAA
jgi:hypothetical protein